MSSKSGKSSEKSSSEKSIKSKSSKQIQPTQQTQPVVTVNALAEQICFWGKQSISNSTNSPIVPGEVSTDIFGKPRRLYSNIVKRASGKVFQVDQVDNKYPIKQMFFAKSATTHTVSLPGHEPHTFNSGTINIHAGDLELSRRDSSGNTSRATVKQEALINIATGEIKFKLIEDTKKVLYVSQYKINGLFTSSPTISLNPYTTEESRKFIKLPRTKTVLERLDGQGKHQINIYTYLNANFSDSLDTLKQKLEQFKKQVRDFEKFAIQNDEQKLAIKKFNYVKDVLADEESLSTYKSKLSQWYSDYNYWSQKEGEQKPIEQHDYLLEFRETGKPRLSNYMDNLITRTVKYDPEHIIYTEEDEQVIDYLIKESAEKEQRLDTANLKKLEADLARENAQVKPSQTVIKRLEKQIEKARVKAAKSLKERMTVTKKMKIAENYGLYPPYLISDILRYVPFYGNNRRNLTMIDALALSSENIETFATHINGFKSLVFNVASLYAHLATHKILNSHLCSCGGSPQCEIAKKIIPVSYSSGIYSKLSWLMNQHDAEGKSIIYNVEPSITQYVMFKPCSNSESVLSILANTPEASQINTAQILLPVDEPLIVGDTTGVADFDLLYAESFKQKSGLIDGLINFLTADTLQSNFREFLEVKYNYTEDISKKDINSATTEFNLESEYFPSVEQGEIKISLPETDIPTETSTPTDILNSIGVFQPSSVTSQESVIPVEMPANVSETSTPTEVQVLKSESITPEPVKKPVSAWGKGASSLIFKPLTPEQIAEQEAKIQAERKLKQEEIERKHQADLQAKAARKQKELEFALARDDESADIKVTNTKAGIKVDSSADNESLSFPIKYITTKGYIKIGNETNTIPHSFSSGDIVEITFNKDPDNKNIQQFAGIRYNIRSIDEFTIMIENFTNLNGTAPIVFKQGKAIITRIPDAMISYDNKEQRKATKHEGDVPTESPKQWADRREKLRTAENLAIFNFKTLDEMNQAEENAIIKSLADEIHNNLKSSKIFKHMSDEDKLDIIKARIATLKKSNPENFQKLLMNKLGVLVSQNKTEITENDIGNSGNFEVGHKITKASKAWTEGLIKKAQADGHNVSHLPQDPKTSKSKKANTVATTTESSDKKKKSKGSNKNKHKEKYLKYKAKYLALKAKLGL